MITIIVNGYPKSGVTWLSRLLAEAIGAPFCGYWGGAGRTRPEGLDRVSPYRVFKSHHMPADLYLAVGSKVVHIVRDVRDVICSHLGYWGGGPVKAGSTDPAVLRQGVDGMLTAQWAYENYGGKWGGDGVSWVGHATAWMMMASPALVTIVKFEDLIAEPITQLGGICNAIAVGHGPDLAGAVHRQAFGRKQGLLAHDPEARKLLRRGRPGEHLDVFTPDQHRRAVELFGPTLQRLGYPTESTAREQCHTVVHATAPADQHAAQDTAQEQCHTVAALSEPPR